MSVDEKTGIQALERLHPTLPMKPGQTEKQEFEYRRHGTTCLIASFEVATGQILSSTIQQTCTEEDFAEHIRKIIALVPAASWVIVVDQLNTHKSEMLGPSEHGLPESLPGGSQSPHSARVHPTSRLVAEPGGIWFSILTRRALKRASFSSLGELQQRRLDFHWIPQQITGEAISMDLSGQTAVRHVTPDQDLSLGHLV